MKKLQIVSDQMSVEADVLIKAAILQFFELPESEKIKAVIKVFHKERERKAKLLFTNHKETDTGSISGRGIGNPCSNQIENTVSFTSFNECKASSGVSPHPVTVDRPNRGMNAS